MPSRYKNENWSNSFEQGLSEKLSEQELAFHYHRQQQVDYLYVDINTAYTRLSEAAQINVVAYEVAQKAYSLWLSVEHSSTAWKPHL